LNLALVAFNFIEVGRLNGCRKSGAYQKQTRKGHGKAGAGGDHICTITPDLRLGNAWVRVFVN